VKRNLIKSQSGTEMVEFAIVAVLLFLLLFGIIDFGILLFDKQVITNASREGARYGIIQGTSRIASGSIATSGTIKYVVGQYCYNNLVNFSGSSNITDLNITVTNLTGGGTRCRDGSTGFGDELQVTVTYPYTFLALPGVVRAAGGTLGNITLQSQTTMKCE
jgi:Flp pilus assembly protein TadG